MRYRYDPARTWGAAPPPWIRTPVIEKPVSSRPVPGWRRAHRNLSLPRTTSPVGLSKIDHSMITGPPRTGGPVRNGVGAQKDGLKPVPGPVDDQVAGLAGAALARSWEAKAPWRRPPQAFNPRAAGASPACLFRGAPPVAPRRRSAVAGFGLNDE